MRFDRPETPLMVRNAARLLLDVVYPPRCAGCGHPGAWVCDECEPRARRIESLTCERCGAGHPADECLCAELDPALAVVRSVGLYEAWLRRAIVSFKYEHESDRAEHLGALLATIAVDRWQVDCLVPVPLHPRRLRERGYDQAALLARRAGFLQHLPVASALERTRPTPRQVGLSGPERVSNVAGAFAVSPSATVLGRRILLVDDVLTTGSTLSNCASALADAGADWVGAITLARGG